MDPKTMAFGVVDGPSFSDIMRSLTESPREDATPVAFTVRILGRRYVASVHIIRVVHWEPNGLILKGVKAQLAVRMKHFDPVIPDKVDLHFEVYRPDGSTIEERGNGRIAEDAIQFLPSK